MNYEKEKICPYCGNTFISRSPSGIWCSEKCYSASRRKEYMKSQKEKKARKKKPVKTLAEVCREAREHGMSYGEYVARYGV